MILAALILTFTWFFTQSFLWRPVSRSVHPERLPGDEALPGVDVFICTADPKKEPTLQVMNTVISAMCLDYPPERLAIYLSDDGGAAVTLSGMREAAVLARWWIPFCRKYNIKTRCPGAYFSAFNEGYEQDICGGDFQVEQDKIKVHKEVPLPPPIRIYGSTTSISQISRVPLPPPTRIHSSTSSTSQIGYIYECLSESTFTGYYLQCQGWKSVYSYPKKPAFLGCATIDMKDALVQQRKWNGNLLELGFSKFSPLAYAISRMSFLHSMCYAYFAFQPLVALSLLIDGIFPQFCFFKGVSLFPKVTDPWFALFAVVWISSLLQHLYEVLSSGGSLRTWWNEQRIWVIKIVSGSLLGCIDCLMKKLGISKTAFRLTNKAIEKEKLENYEKGKFDFEGARLFMVPLVGLVIWNMACLVGGIWRLFVVGNVGEMFGHLFLSSFLLLVSYPIIEGIVTRKGKAKM